MTGFEPRISGIGSDCSTNWATTTALHTSTLYLPLRTILYTCDVIAGEAEHHAEDGGRVPRDDPAEVPRNVRPAAQQRQVGTVIYSIPPKGNAT